MEAVPLKFTGGRKQKVNGKQGSNCTRIKYDKIYVYPSAGKGIELHKAAKLPV